MRSLIYVSPFVLLCGCEMLKAVMADPDVAQHTQEVVVAIPAAVEGSWIPLITILTALVSAVGVAAYKYKKRVK